MVKLSDIAEISTGSHDSQDAVPDGKYTFFARGEAPLLLDAYDYVETAIITAGDGAGVGKVFHYFTGKYALHQRAYRIHPIGTLVNPRYVYHYITCAFPDYILKESVSSSVRSIRRKMLDNFILPLPSLEKQNDIASSLDAFSSFVSSLTSGLPAEIEARRKQYEYYRDKLLTFEEKKP